MKQPIGQAPHFLVCCLGIWGLLISPAMAQVNGPGPSPANLFDTVINLPGDEDVITGSFFESVGGVAGQTTQLNVSGGGVVGYRFDANSGSEVNISGGDVDNAFTLSGSEANISGGTVGFDFGAFLGSVVNISGGTVNAGFSANSGSVVNISGGVVTRSFWAYSGSVVNLSGGTLGERSSVCESVVNITGGTLGRQFVASSGSEVNITGGTLGPQFNASTGSVVNISGGTVGGGFDANSGSVVNINGGTVDDDFRALSGSVVNISGSAFSIDGAPLNILLAGQPVTITDRDVTLSGLLADGEQFSFELNSYGSFPEAFFDPDATLTVTIVSPVTLGDVNLDGVVDFSDIPAFIAVLISGEFQAEADCNQDDEVNFSDIPAFIDILLNN